MFMDLITWVVIVGVGVAIAVVPIKDLRKATSIFTFKKFGIRKKKRWNALIDDLGNFFLLLSFVYCCVYWLIPYYRQIYAVWIMFTLIVTLSRAVVITSKYPKDKKGKLCTILVDVGIYLVGAIGLAGAVGAFNNEIFLSGVDRFARDLQSGGIHDYMYFLTNPSFFYVVLEGLIMFIPLMFLWNNFKYMRTERTIRAANVATFTIKVLIVCALMTVLSYEGFSFLNMVYCVDLKQI